MIITTTETIPGKKIVKTFGLVRGNTIRAKHIGRDIVAGLRNIVGGEIVEYTKMLAESREQSLDRMIESAEEKGVLLGCDQYPYPAGSTWLAALLPYWVQAGGYKAIVKRLATFRGQQSSAPTNYYL